MKKNLLLDINNETSRLSDFVENLLNMTRLNANQLVLHLKNELVEDIMTDVYHRVQNRLGLHQLFIEQNEDMDYVYTDAPLLIQVLTNLVDNAIRHTKEDATITMSYSKTTEGIEFKVSDNGGGIVQSDLSKIFTDFVSIETGKGDKTRGFGLGLSICQAIVKAHGGTIRALNNELGGATFLFALPAEK
jgi:two-component system sensor histidine kinase KdpD